MTNRRRALIAAPNHWTSVLQVGTHHIARALVEDGWDVAYLSDPVSPFHVAAIGRIETRQRFRLWLRGGQMALDEHLFAYVPSTLWSPRGPALLGRRATTTWAGRTVPSLKAVLRKAGFGAVDLVWIDSVIWEPIVDDYPGAKTVLRIADRASGFKGHTPGFGDAERRLAGRVDLVVYSATTLREHVESLGPRASQYMLNGVDLARFTTSTGSPSEYSSISAPRAVYVGAMDSWFDFDLVAAVADRLPDVSFVLIGPDELARRRLNSRPNLHLLGRQPAVRIPAFLQHASVGLIPFDVPGHAELVSAVHPLKLYEYFASGLPVVAARWPELETLASPATLYTDLEDAVNAVRRTISEPMDGALLRSWVAGADWSSRIQGPLDTLFGSTEGQRVIASP